VEAEFGITRRYLELAAWRGDGPPMIKLRRAVRYKRSDILAWIDARRIEPEPSGSGAITTSRVNARSGRQRQALPSAQRLHEVEGASRNGTNMTAWTWKESEIAEPTMR
jgi:hypothetical protein